MHNYQLTLRSTSGIVISKPSGNTGALLSNSIHGFSLSPELPADTSAQPVQLAGDALCAHPSSGPDAGVLLIPKSSNLAAMFREGEEEDKQREFKRCDWVLSSPGVVLVAETLFEELVSGKLPSHGSQVGVSYQLSYHAHLTDAPTERLRQIMLP